MSVVAPAIQRTSTWPADLADATIFRAETDLGAATQPLLQLFRAVDHQAYNDGVGAQFLAACDQLAAWAEKHERPSLRKTAAQVAEDFHAVWDSPLDVDANVASLLWNRLAPELVQLLGEPAASAPSPKVCSGPESFWQDPDGPSCDPPSDPKGQQQAVVPNQAKSRLVQVEDRQLDQAAEHAWELYAGVHALADLEGEVDGPEGAGRFAEKLRYVTRDLTAQAEAMKQSVATLRHVPAGPFFAEFTPLVERLATWLGKRIQVRIEGESVLVERLVVDDLRLPLIDWVENTVRKRLDTTNLWLAAKRTDGRLRITVRDDAAPDDGKTDCLPQLNALSEAMRPYRGRVQFDSSQQSGATLSLDLPSQEATSALRGLTFRQGTGIFVVPLEQVREIVSVDAGDLRSVQGRNVITLHRATYEAHCLGRLLDIPPSFRAEAQPRAGILVQHGGHKACLVVDEVLGQRQLVLRRMADIMPGMDQFLGVAPLGDSRLAFVLNVAILLGRA